MLWHRDAPPPYLHRWYRRSRKERNPDAHNMLLQIMEKDTYPMLRAASRFRNAIIVMTSNIGADMIKRQTSLGFTLQRDEATDERLHMKICARS